MHAPAPLLHVSDRWPRPLLLAFCEDLKSGFFELVRRDRSVGGEPKREGGEDADADTDDGMVVEDKNQHAT